MAKQINPKLKAAAMRALPNIIKGYSHWAIALWLGFQLAVQTSNTYGDEWKTIDGLTILMNLISQFGIYGGALAGVIAAFEGYRQKY